MNRGHIIGGLVGLGVVVAGGLVIASATSGSAKPGTGGSSSSGGGSGSGGPPKPVGKVPLSTFEAMSSWPVMQESNADGTFSLFAVDSDDYTEAVDVFEPFATRYLMSNVRLFVRQELEASDPDVRRISLTAPTASNMVEVVL